MSNANKFIKSSVIYFVGNVLTKVISIFLLPIFTSYIVPKDMGYYQTSTAYLSMLTAIVSLEIWSAMMRFMFDYAEKKDKYKPIVNGLSIFCVSVLLYSIVFIVVAFIKRDLQYLGWIYLYGLLTMLHSIYSYIVRGFGFNKVFAYSGIIGSLVNALSNIIMILGFGMRLSSMYIAYLLGILTQLVIMESKIHILTNIKREYIDFTIMKSMFRFALPLSLNSACFWFLSNYNTVAITNILGVEASGLYSIGARFTGLLTLVTTCFSMAWQELAYSKGNDKDKSAFYTLATNYYIKFLMIGILIFIPAIQVVFPFFVNAQYQESFKYIPIYILATAASIISNFLGNIFGAEKNTKVIFTSTLIAAVVNVSLINLLIGKLGLQAANISLLFGFVVNIIIRIFLLQKSVKIKINFIFLATSLFLFGIAWWVYLNLNCWWNIGLTVVFVIFGLFIFKDLIYNFWNLIKARIKDKKVKL